MKLKVITASQQLLEKDGVQQVNLPGIEGEMGILPGHVNLISPLNIGKIEYKDNDGMHVIVLNGGFVRVFDDEVFIMADEAELAEDVTLHKIDDAIKDAESKVLSGLEPAELIQLEKQLRYEKIKKIAAESMA
jgi:F-type H+-transporting ATPase subunit epsilon